MMKSFIANGPEAGACGVTRSCAQSRLSRKCKEMSDERMSRLDQDDSCCSGLRFWVD
jgi:hypothetical protein